jgi:hypothetical protein
LPLSKSSSLPKLNSNIDSLTQLLFDRLLAGDDEVVVEDIDEGEDGTELECDDDGGVSKSGNDRSGSFNFSSLSQSIRSSRSSMFIILLLSLTATSSIFSSSSSLHMISSMIVVC